MKEENKETLSPPMYYEEDEIDLYELWLVLVKRKKWILGITFLAVVLALIICFILPPVYKTEATLMPLGGKEKGLGGLSALAGLAGISLPSSGSGITVEAVLKSRILRERIVKRLNLLPRLFPDKWDEEHKRWILENEEDHPPTVFDGAEALKDMISVSSDRKTGVLTLSVEYPKDPELAYQIAEVALNEAQKILNEKSFTMARKYRLYVEKRLKEAREVLKKTEDIYEKFMAGKIKEVPLTLDEEIYQEYGKLRGRLLARKEALRALKEVSPDSREKIAKLKKEIAELKEKLRSMERQGGFRSYVAPPEYQLNLKKLQARLEIALGLYETLLKEYELAKAQEMKEAISFQVIDPPYVPDPEKPYKPKKKLIVAVAGVSGLFLGIFLAFFMEWLENVKKRHQETRREDEEVS